MGHNTSGAPKAEYCDAQKTKQGVGDQEGAGSTKGVKPKQLFCFGKKEILNRNQNEESCPELVQFFYFQVPLGS